VSLDQGWRLATGTLTAIPVRGPAHVDRATARAAMLLAPVAVLPLGLAVTLLGLGGRWLDVPPLVVGVLAVALLALATRALHWDGLSDVADGLTASFDAERSLAVMKTGTSGPAGTLAVVLVVGLQALGFASLVSSTEGAVLAGVLVVVSRCALAVTCSSVFAPARTDGLGLAFAGVVPAGAAAASWSAAILVVAAACVVTDVDAARPVMACVVALLVVAALARHTARRFGGVTGDVYGAAVEVALATLLVVVA
jgi:adenosylcobinamide-GDP ribazoletransferase